MASGSHSSPRPGPQRLPHIRPVDGTCPDGSSLGSHTSLIATSALLGPPDLQGLREEVRARAVDLLRNAPKAPAVVSVNARPDDVDNTAVAVATREHDRVPHVLNDRRARAGADT